MANQSVAWVQDGVDPGWFFARGVGSVRSSISYRPGGWWFLASWLPDTADHDIGPFKTKSAAIPEAERLVDLHLRQEQH